MRIKLYFQTYVNGKKDTIDLSNYFFSFQFQSKGFCCLRMLFTDFGFLSKFILVHSEKHLETHSEQHLETPLENYFVAILWLLVDNK